MKNAGAWFIIIFFGGFALLLMHACNGIKETGVRMDAERAQRKALENCQEAKYKTCLNEMCVRIHYRANLCQDWISPSGIRFPFDERYDIRSVGCTQEAKDSCK